MGYPRILIDLEKIGSNTQEIRNLCKDIQIVGVTKLVLGEPKIAKIFLENGINMIGDSRLKNIVKMREARIGGPFQLLRIPMPSELKSAVEIVDEILVSDPKVAVMLDSLCEKYGKNLQIIYMIDLGDLREGVWYEKAVEEITETFHKLKHVTLKGIGTNLGCYGGVLPSVENMNLLVSLKREIESSIGKEVFVSGGSTVTLKMVEEKTLPKEINQLRIGEALLLGTDATGNRDIPYLSQETMILEAEVIEVDYKPSVPVGQRGCDAFGRVPVFEDKGRRKRIILAIGEQDVKPDGLKPLVKEMEVLHASSDHLIVDVTQCEKEFNIGDIVQFRMSYGCALRALTSPYVEKVYI